MLVRRFNSESNQSVDHLNITDDSRFLIYSSDDFVLRTAGLLGGAFPRVKLRGHKAPIMGTVCYFEFNNTLLSIDQVGLVFLWELVEKDEEDLNQKGFKSLAGNKINKIEEESSVAEIQHLSELEKKFMNSRFILKTKK